MSDTLELIANAPTVCEFCDCPDTLDEQSSYEEQRALRGRWLSLSMLDLEDTLLLDGVDMNLWPALKQWLYENINEICPDSVTYETFKADLIEVVRLAIRVVHNCEFRPKVFTTDLARKQSWDGFIEALDATEKSVTE